MIPVTTDMDTPHSAAPCVATIGFFDGVHRGHKFLIKSVIDRAAELGLQSAVVTFDTHPRLVLNKEFQPRLLTTSEEKRRLIAATGVNRCEMLHFDGQMASLSAYDFMKDVLRGRLNVRRLITGYDNRFGHNRAEGFDDYVRYGRELGIEVERAEAFVLNGVNVSSSVVRSFLSAGEVDMAAMCLGYHYRLGGTVVGGYHEGRKLGFPTANIDLPDPRKLLPAIGVYAVRVHLGHDSHPGMLNIGIRPTVSHEGILTREVNIFDLDRDLYGTSLSVEILARVRGEQKFENLAELQAQLHRDKTTVLTLLTALPR